MVKATTLASISKQMERGFSAVADATSRATDKNSRLATRSGSEVFTISAVPYWQLDVTLGRVGDPSGTSDQPDYLEIVNIDRGDLFKVWFTKNGVLNVVVALPEQEAQLTEILKSWQFTD